MTVDLEAIARRSGCDLSSLKLALPLIEQGLAPPFLARYRRDELGGISEAALWMLQRAVRNDQQLANRREELLKQWQRTRLQDKSIERAIRDARSKAAISRVARRLKSEAVDPQATIAAETWVASRVLNPEPGDSTEIAPLAEAVGQVEQLEQIEANLDRALARRIAEHPQILSAAVRWLSANAAIKFLEVSDPNVDTKAAGDQADEPTANSGDRPSSEPGANWPSPEQLTSATEPAANGQTTDPTAGQIDGDHPADGDIPADGADQAAGITDTADGPSSVSAALAPAARSAEDANESSSTQPSSTQADGAAATGDGETTGTAPATGAAPAAGAGSAESDPPAGGSPGGKKKDKKAKAAKPIVKKTKVFKKLSPRQRRRRWLISILEPLVGKQVATRDLSPFQTLVLSRALRGNLVKCQFVYDANQLVAQLQKVASNLNPALAERLEAVIAADEAAIRDTTEAVWWEELQELATARLVDIAAGHLARQLHRGPLEAKTVLAIDAVGPRTSPVAIVTADGRVLHSEDISCQLETDLRTGSVTRLGELIHRFGVDLIVIGNGPARRATLIILGELLGQSPEGSINWTLAERSGADIYAGSELADREMRTTPRRFRAATWLAFSVLNPAWALAKINPLRLRLSSIQRELPDDALATALNDVMASAISRGGLDVNTAAVDSLAQLPGMNRAIATAIDRRRRQSLFRSREDLLSLPQWGDGAASRQAIGYLRVFGSEEPLDGTVIHPDDYSLARKLAKALSLEIPPAAPAGYQPPTFDQDGEAAASGPVISDQTPAAAAPMAQSFEASKESPDFAAELLATQTADQPESQPAADTQETAPAAEAMAGDTVVNNDATVGSESAGETPADESPADVSPAEGDPAAAAVATDSVDSDQSTDSETPATDSATAEASDGEQDPVAATFKQPLPDPAAINKCIREWQVGSCRAHHLVHALCDPFGEEKLGDLTDPPAVMNRLPKPNELRAGDTVIGVVASVAPFGAFVEITPESTGLIRVSRLAEEFVEEIHDYLQVGDVITAWVSEVDQRRKLQLSAISPQREEELRVRRQEARQQRHSRGGGPRRGGGGRDARGGGEGSQRGGQGGTAGRGRQGGQAGRDGQAAAGRGPHAGGQRGEQRGRPPRGGGQGRDQQRGSGGRDGGRGRSRRDEPISYTTRVPKNPLPLEPLSDAMAEGKEPMRSFGDLLQFFQKDQPQTAVAAKPKSKAAKPQPKPEPVAPSSGQKAEDKPAGEPTQSPTAQVVQAQAGQAQAQAQATGDAVPPPPPPATPPKSDSSDSNEPSN